MDMMNNNGLNLLEGEAETIKVPAETTNVKAAPAREVRVVPVKATSAPIHLHHGLVGVGLLGVGVAFSLAAPGMKPLTRIVAGGLLSAVGAVLILDDWQQHSENGCGIDTWFSFLPCPHDLVAKAAPVTATGATTIVVRKKDESQGVRPDAV